MSQIVDLLDDILADDILDTADVARVVGSTVGSIARWRTADVALAHESEERLLELEAVLDLARYNLRPGSARLWFRSPNPELNYSKPLDLIAHGEHRRVAAALLAMAEGLTT